MFARFALTLSVFAVFGLLITLGEAVAYVLSGMYGEIRDLGAGNAILIILQLFLAGIIVMLLDELMQKGTIYTRPVHLQQASVLDLAFRCSSRLTFARPSSGNHSRQPLSIKAVARSSRVRSLRFSTCWSPSRWVSQAHVAPLT